MSNTNMTTAYEIRALRVERARASVSIWRRNAARNPLDKAAAERLDAAIVELRAALEKLDELRGAKQPAKPAKPARAKRPSLTVAETHLALRGVAT